MKTYNDTTDLMSSAFARNFLDQRRTVGLPINNNNDQSEIFLQNTSSEIAFHPTSSSLIPHQSSISNIHLSLSQVPEVKSSLSPPPLKKLRYSSIAELRTNAISNECNTSQGSTTTRQVSPNSILPPPPILPPLDNSWTSQSTQNSVDSSQPTVSSYFPSKPTFETLDTSSKAAITQRRKLSSSIFSPHLSEPSMLVKSNLHSNPNSIKLGQSFSIGFSCNQCDKTFSREEDLKAHKKGHIRPFSCRVKGCCASFSKANHLSRHIRIVHNKERPFACTVPGCGSRFGSKSHLGDHTRAVHMRLRTFKCDICNASWSKRFNLQKHIRIRHLGEKPYRCAICNMSFGTLSHVTRHEATVHKKANE